MRKHKSGKTFRRDQYNPDNYGKQARNGLPRVPRPALRKQGTRKGAVLAATREAGIR